MSKFAKQLSASNKDIKGQRADMLAQEVGLEAEDLVRGLKREKMTLQNKIMRLTDLAPDTKDSLRPGGKDFDAQSWVRELHQSKMDLKLKDIELNEAEAIVAEWFSDEK